MALVWFYLLCSVITFMAYAVDKSAARAGRRRTPEKTLHLLALSGGWPGALAAQQLLRHKSRKRPFQRLFWTTVALHCAALGWLWLSAGAASLRAMLGQAW